MILEHRGKRYEVVGKRLLAPGDTILCAFADNGSPTIQTLPHPSYIGLSSEPGYVLRELPSHTNGKPVLRADVTFDGTYEVWTTDCPPDIPANTQNASRESLKFVRRRGERVWCPVIDTPTIEVGSVWHAGFDAYFPQYQTVYAVVMAFDPNGSINGIKMPRVDVQHFGDKFFSDNHLWHQEDFLQHFRLVTPGDVVVHRDGGRRRRFVKIGRHPGIQMQDVVELLPLDFLDPEPAEKPSRNCGHCVSIQVPVGVKKEDFVISLVKCPICETYCLTH
jgi:hypothetical protein